jgi:hypothetical protein
MAIVPAKSKNIGMMAQMKITNKVRKSVDAPVITNMSVLNNMELTSEIFFDRTSKAIENTMLMSPKVERVSL